MALAHEDDVASGGPRRGRRNLSWAGTLSCFGSQEASAAESTTTTPWERSSSRRRWKKRTVPVVDGDLVAGTAADSEEVMKRGSGSGSGSGDEESRKPKGLRLPGCRCFLAPGREHSAMDGGGGRRNKQRRHLESTEQRWRRSQSDKNSPSEAASSSQVQATGGSTSTSTSNGSRSRGAEQRPPAETRTPSFGPVVGLSVVVAVSMAGLLLGGRLWAVACVCAWLAALSRLRRREATAGEVVAVDVDSTDHKEPVVVLRGLLERDRPSKAVAAA